MDEQKFREWLNTIIPTLKLFVAGFSDGWESFINYLNWLDKEQIKKFYDEYSSSRKLEKINRVRVNILKKLLEWSITLDEVNSIFDEEKKLWSERQLWVWNIPRIIYPFCYWENRCHERYTWEFLTELWNTIVEKAWYDKSIITDPWQVNFDWATNFWKNWFYVWFWNNSHPDYKTQNQFRIESEWDNQLKIWIFHYGIWFIEWKYKLFDINTITLQNVIDEAIQCKDIVESDIFKWNANEKTNSNQSSLSVQNIEMSTLSLNTILYWVPGTWKTYNTVNYAVAAIEWKSVKDVCDEDWDTVKDRYDQYKSDWQIVFTTFHQSFWYEDFIEWIKATVEENWNINYDVQSWIFKNLCEVANSEGNILNVSQNNIDVNNIQIFKMSLWEVWRNDDVYDYCIENNVIATWFWDMDFTKLEKSATPKEIKDFIYENNPNEESKFTADAIFRFKTWMNVGDLVIISKWNFYVRAIWKVISEYYYDENTPIEYKHFRKVEWLLKDVNIPVERISNKKFSQQSIYNLKDNAYKQTSLKLDEIKKLIWVSSSFEKRNYVLIIDEINRWNISKIFWELITLIEPNKRLWGKEELKVVLPYSQKEFWVPSNLYIIWTMNTADRSIALIDLALRRRFKFKEIEPKSKLLDWIVVDWNIDIKSMFEKINERIEFLYDRDHLLWHAYFLPLRNNNTREKLDSIMLNDIIPQLQEYFHEDWEKIQLILWNWLIKNEDMDPVKIIWYSWDYDIKPKYSINYDPKNEDYIKIYQPINDKTE